MLNAWPMIKFISIELLLWFTKIPMHNHTHNTKIEETPFIIYTLKTKDNEIAEKKTENFTRTDQLQMKVVVMISLRDARFRECLYFFFVDSFRFNRSNSSGVAETAQHTIPCSALFEYLYSTTVVFNVFGFLLTTHKHTHTHRPITLTQPYSTLIYIHIRAQTQYSRFVSAVFHFT